MECKSLSNLLNALRSKIHDKDRELEIDEIQNILSTSQGLSQYIEALCRTLSLTFTFHVTKQLIDHVATVCRKALTWGPNPEKVLEEVDSSINHNNMDITTIHLIQAWMLSRACDFESAIKSAQDAQRVAINSGQHIKVSWARNTEGSIYCARACDAVKLGFLRRAETFLKKVCILRRRIVRDWINLGVIQTELGKFSDALSAFNRALKIDVGDHGAWSGKAAVFFHQEDYEEAESIIREGMKFSRSVGSLYAVLGAIFSKKGQPFTSINFSYRALTLGHKSPDVLRNLGLELERIRQYGAAISKFRESASLEPGNISATLSIIWLFDSIGQLSYAAQELNRLLVSQLLQLKVAPFAVVRQFVTHHPIDILKNYDLVLGSGHSKKPPGCGEHIIDHYLSGVQQVLIDNLKIQELKHTEVITGLIHIGILWSFYAEKLSKKGLSKQFARERLYAIKQDILQAAPQEAKKSGFTSAWMELEARMKTSSDEEFAKEMISQESKWLTDIGEGQQRGDIEDLRWRLKGNLWIHLFEYQHERRLEHMERIHYYMELLKGNTVLHKLANPTSIRTKIDIEQWNRYVNSLPVKVEQTAFIDLRSCTNLLPQNAVGLSFYFLKRELVPDLLLVLVFKQGQEPSLRVVDNGAARLKKYQDTAKRLKQVHDQVAWRQKLPTIGKTFNEIIGNKSEQEPLKGEKLVKAVAEWQKKQLHEAYKAIFEGVIDEAELQGKDIYISPSPEMYEIPFALLYGKSGFLNNIVNSITIMPIFSLTQFQRSGIFPRGPGFVLCLDRNWQIEMKSRFDYLSKSWSNGEVHTEVEQEQIRKGGKVEIKYDNWIRNINSVSISHIIGHHDALQWSRSTKSEPNLGQFGRYLYHSPEKLRADVLVLEACWSGTWSAPEDLMGLFVSILASGVKWTVASPYSLVPTHTSKKLFEHIYNQKVGHEDGQVGLDMARAIRNAAEAVRQPTFSGDENVIPTLWGSLQLYAAT